MSNEMGGSPKRNGRNTPTQQSGRNTPTQQSGAKKATARNRLTQYCFRSPQLMKRSSPRVETVLTPNDVDIMFEKMNDRALERVKPSLLCQILLKQGLKWVGPKKSMVLVKQYQENQDSRYEDEYNRIRGLLRYGVVPLGQCHGRLGRGDQRRHVASRLGDSTNESMIIPDESAFSGGADSPAVSDFVAGSAADCAADGSSSGVEPDEYWQGAFCGASA